MARAALSVLGLASLVALGTLGHPVGAPGAAEGTRPKPNIVLVMTDDQDYRSVRAMPAVRRLLIRKGTSFVHNYATYPLCCPSRATLHTGLYAHNHGVLSNEFTQGGGYPEFVRNIPGRRTLAARLDRRGYFTGFAGKYMNGYGIERPLEIPNGWDRWAGLTRHSEYQMWGYTLNDQGRLVRPGYATRNYQTDVLGRRAAAMIEAGASGSRPFFVVLSPVAPHSESDAALGPSPARNPRPAPRHRNRYTGGDFQARKSERSAARGAAAWRA